MRALYLTNISRQKALVLLEGNENCVKYASLFLLYILAKDECVLSRTPSTYLAYNYFNFRIGDDKGN